MNGRTGNGPSGGSASAWGEAMIEDIRRATAGAAAAAAALSLQAKWEAEAAAAVERMPGVRVEDGGECLYLNSISPGCRACKNGEWDCIFVTMACNLRCAFCWRPCAPTDGHLGSAFDSRREEIAAAYARTRISGISFSGGEVFLDPAALFDWIRWATQQAPGRYYWLYTNGLVATEEHLAQAAELGVHEARFNMAASGYADPEALRRLQVAARHFAAVTVEVPAIPEEASQLLNALPLWSEAGARYLNLHELVYEPGTYSASMRGPRCAGDLGDGHAFAYHPESRALTLAVMEKVAAERLPLGVNDCSLHSKWRQIRGRRRTLAPLLKKPWERPAGDSMLETFGVWGESTVRLFHPKRLDEVRSAFPEARLVRLLRLAPLCADAVPLWQACEPL